MTVEYIALCCPKICSQLPIFHEHTKKTQTNKKNPTNKQKKSPKQNKNPHKPIKTKQKVHIHEKLFVLLVSTTSVAMRPLYSSYTVRKSTICSKAAA